MQDTTNETVRTCGIHHVGLAVGDLESAENFFVEALGWKVVGGRPSYPAIFVSDGTVTVTLWRVADPATAIHFDRRANIGLHHLALKVSDRSTLESLHRRLSNWPGVTIEFSPEPMREGSAIFHFICAMPGGIRIEFAMAGTSSK